jgi:lysophospholipase L1-like esterase
MPSASTPQGRPPSPQPTATRRSPPRSPVVQSVVFVALVVLLLTLVAQGGSTSSNEAYVISSAAQAAHIRRLQAEHRAKQPRQNTPPPQQPHYNDGSASFHGSDASTLTTTSHAGVAADPLDRITALLRPHSESNLRWLAIGDSITQGIAPAAVRSKRTKLHHPVNGTCSYLTPLSMALGPKVSFVGPYSAAHAGPYAATCSDTGRRHAATWGITAEQVSSNKDYRAKYRALRMSLDGSAREPLSRGAKVYDWVREYRPHIVSILIGTNDLAGGTGHHVTLDDYIQPMVVQAMRAAEDATAMDSHEHSEARRRANQGRCEIIVLLMTLLPRADEVQQLVENFNEKLERRDQAWLHERCLEVLAVSDHLDAANSAQFYDGLHPAAIGENIVAFNIVRELTIWEQNRSHNVTFAAERSAKTTARWQQGRLGADELEERAAAEVAAEGNDVALVTPVPARDGA